MKPNFDNAGVAQVQASVVGLPASELADELAQVRADFKAWMREHFDLTTSQEQQLDLMPTDFTARLANAIADRWEQRIVVPFYKETSAKGNSNDLKDLIINGQNQLTYTLGSNPSVTAPELSIWIRYQSHI